MCVSEFCDVVFVAEVSVVLQEHLSLPSPLAELYLRLEVSVLT